MSTTEGWKRWWLVMTMVILAIGECFGQEVTTLLKVTLADHKGYPTIHVSPAIMPNRYAELGWADTNLPPTFPRRVGRFPLQIEPLGAALRGPNVFTNAELFTTAPTFFLSPMLRNCVTITVQNEDGDILRELTVTPGLRGLLDADGTVSLDPGETAGTGAERYCYFDLTGLPNGITVVIWIQVKIGNGYGNVYIPAITGRNEVRQPWSDYVAVPQ